MGRDRRHCDGAIQRVGPLEEIGTTAPTCNGPADTRLGYGPMTSGGAALFATRVDDRCSSRGGKHHRRHPDPWRRRGKGDFHGFVELVLGPKHCGPRSRRFSVTKSSQHRDAHVPATRSPGRPVTDAGAAAAETALAETPSAEATILGARLDEHHSPETNGRMAVCRRCGAQTESSQGRQHVPNERRLSRSEEWLDAQKRARLIDSARKARDT